MADFDTLGGRPATTTLKWWSVRNFKSLLYAITPLEGLTAITGANSAGKSSLLQTLLLVAQSADQEVTLNGNLTRLGVPRDVIRAGTSSFAIACIATIRMGNERSEWSFDITLRPTVSGLRVSEFEVTRDSETVLVATDSRVTEKTRAHVDPDGQFGDTLLRVREVQGSIAPAHTYVSFNGFTPIALHTRAESKLVLRDLKRTFSLAAIREDRDIASQFTDLVLSNFYHTRAERSPGPATDAIRSVLGTALLDDASQDRLSKRTLDALLTELANQDEENEWQRIPVRGVVSLAQRRTPRHLALLMPSIAAAYQGLVASNEMISRVVQTVRYVGPLREEPQVVSKSATRSRHTPVGLRGELTAELLHTRTARVRYWDWEGTMHRTSLKAAVSLWSARLGIGDQVSVEDQGKLGRGLRISVNGVARDLTMVGVGASQLLPVLSAVLEAPAGSVVLLEQPELHLHPSVQSRLADFLLFARHDISLVVETHSEYLITRLRRWVAEGQAKPNQIHILFAEPSADGTDVRNLKLNELGNLNDWPEGFFDSRDTEAHAIVKAIAERRHLE